MEIFNEASLQKSSPSEVATSMKASRDMLDSMADDLDGLIVNGGIDREVSNNNKEDSENHTKMTELTEDTNDCDIKNIDTKSGVASEDIKLDPDRTADVKSDDLEVEDMEITMNQKNLFCEENIENDPDLTIIESDYDTYHSLSETYHSDGKAGDWIENDPDLTIIDMADESCLSLDETYYSAQDMKFIIDDDDVDGSSNNGNRNNSSIQYPGTIRVLRKFSEIDPAERDKVLSQYLSVVEESWPMCSSMSFSYTPDVNDQGENDEDFVMGESTCTLTLLDVADILQAGYAFISGGKTADGCPIITFPDIPEQVEISDDQYRRVVNYLTSIPSLQEVDLGFVLIVDRRQCGWGSIKTMLLKIAGFFPGLVNEVCVLRPSGFFQRTVADVGFKFVRDDFKFKVLMYSSPEELREHIPRAQLTADVGGTLKYDHQEWIQQRAVMTWWRKVLGQSDLMRIDDVLAIIHQAIEKFSANTTQIGHTLRTLCQRLQETEFPNDVTSTEALILSHESERSEVKEDIRTTLRHGEILLGCFKSVQQPEGEEEVDSASLPSCKLAHVTAVERLLVQLEETERNFDDFWYHHEKRLQQCLQLRKFEEDFKQMHFLVARQVETIETMTDMGDSISRVETLLKELADFEKDSETVVEKGEEVQHMGEQLIREEHYAVDCIRPKCMELQQMCEQYRELVRSRYEVLQRSKDLQERIDKANKWCSRGSEILAGDDVEGYETIEEVENALKDVENFLETVDDLRLNNPREFRQMFDSMITPETRGVVQDLLKRIEDTQTACQRRRADLTKTLSQIARPAPIPPPTPESGVSSAASQSGSSDRSESPVSDDRKRKKSLTPNIMKKNHSSDKLQRMRVEIIRNDGDVSDNSITSLEEGDSTVIPTDMDTINVKRGHVMRELIDTERIYVSEVSDILTGYLQEMNNPEMEPLIPEDLKGRESVLFGNLDKIHEFHSTVFLKDLENCRHTPHSVGKCFVSRDKEFQIYSYYCQNKPNSEALRKEIGDSNPFFKECQKKLNHRLPLSAYLLKPIQRITKYQLLIKEMLKYTNDDASKGELKDALQTMLGVLKYVNDIMHQVAITGFPGKLTELGRLLMQGPFNVWVEHKKDKIKDLRFKPMQRHIFLYEKRLLFCKKKEDPTQIDKSYLYKSSIETADIGLTENVKGDKRKFEIWLNGRTQVYIVQAENMDQKNLWVVEIKKVLMSQFDVLKKAREKPHSATTSSQLQSSISFDNAANNNNPMIHLGYSFSSATDESVGSGSVDYTEEYSSDEFDESPHESFSLDPTLVYVALAEYNPVETGEIRLQKGDLVRVLQEGLEGWWYVRRLGNKDEGWAPASYLDNAKRLSSLSTQSVSSNDSDMGQGFINLRNTASRSSTNSAISSGSHGEETLV